MKKLRKSLAVLLAVIMLATFMPLFASAATITLNANNVIILEAPKITYGDQVEVNKITVNYGVTTKDLTVTGGKLGYIASEGAEPVVIPGTFSGYSTLKLAVGENTAIRLKFTPDDTTTYSSPAISPTYTMADGVVWPSAEVIGQTTILVEAPTAAEILSGQSLREATLSGGVVNDADGNAVSGTWSYVYPYSYPTTSGAYEVQWKKAGFETINTTVNVTVTFNGNAILSEAPSVRRTILGKNLNNVALNGGKVVDENGAEITTGYWSWINDATQSTSAAFETVGTQTFKAQWVALGYPVVIADISVFVAEDMGYTVAKPTLVEEVPFVTNLTYGTLPFVFGESSVPGTYTIAKADTKLTQAHSTKTYNTTVTFTPDDQTLDVTTWSYTFKVIYNSVWKLPDYPEKIVLPYGYQYTSVSRFDTSGMWPQEFTDAGVNGISWDAAEFNAADHEAGYIQLVNVKISHRNVYYNLSTDQIYIQIEPRIVEGDFCEISNMRPDKVTGETQVEIKCEIPGISGEIQVKANGETFATLKPDENGKVYEKVYFTPKTSGDYTFTATYVPNILDKATVVNTEVIGNTVTIDIPELRKLTVYVANQKFEYDVYETHGVYHSWADFSSEPHADVFDHWVVTDGNGKEVTVENLDPKKPHLQFTMPEHDLVLTAKGEIEDMTVSDGSLGGSLWSFWQKLVNFIIEIYRTIVDFFVPAMENV